MCMSREGQGCTFKGKPGGRRGLFKCGAGGGGGIEKAGPGRNWGCLSNRSGQYSLRSMILSNLTFQQAS